MVAQFSAELLETLKKIPTPSVANAIEIFDFRPRNEGFMGPEVRCIYPDLGGMIGYACTATIMADQPAVEGHHANVFQWWEYIQSFPKPRVVVIQDLDKKPIGSFWGEVNANIHKALGCAGVITDGGVRDLDEMRALGFHAFAAEVLVSHAYVHLVDTGIPVRVGGVVVKPGDLVLGDKHGIITVPEEIAKDIPAAVKKVEERERIIIDCCQSKEFSVGKLKEAWTAARKRH